MTVQRASAAREALRKVKPARKPVQTPEGVTLFVHEMTGDQRDAWERRESEIGKAAREGVAIDKADAAEDRARAQGFRARLVAACLHDADGVRVYDPELDEDVQECGSLSTRFIARCFALATDLNLVTKEDEAALVGNSEGDRSAGSGSDSPSPAESPTSQPSSSA